MATEARKISPPTRDEIVARLKDDGDFDSLRLSIIRKVKDNEELRNGIIEEIKQSVALNEDGSEKLKIRQLSDAIYQELGSKILGQISDEVWKVIKSSEMDIRGTVEAVYNKMINPEVDKQDACSSKQLAGGKEDDGQLKKASKSEINEPTEPPGFGSSEKQDKKKSGEKKRVRIHDDQQSTAKKVKHIKKKVEDDVKPPGFGLSSPGSAVAVPVTVEEDPDVPPGFG